MVKMYPTVLKDNDWSLSSSPSIFETFKFLNCFPGSSFAYYEYRAGEGGIYANCFHMMIVLSQGCCTG